MRYRKNVGDLGEEFAANMLENCGHKIIARNYATKAGEIDIISLKNGTIHFVEVKTRTNNEYGYPSEAVTKTKQERMKKAAQSYLRSRRLTWQNVQFDVYEIMADLIEDCI